MLYWILNNGQKNGFGIYKDKKNEKKLEYGKIIK
jgi:hypothetical protein